jgi:hypothetical protein
VDAEFHNDFPTLTLSPFGLCATLWDYCGNVESTLPQRWCNVGNGKIRGGKKNKNDARAPRTALHIATHASTHTPTLHAHNAATTHKQKKWRTNSAVLEGCLVA